MNYFGIATRATILIIPCWTTAETSYPRLGGPEPNGWQLISDAMNEAVIADSLIEMYEANSVVKRQERYTSGHTDAGQITLESLGIQASDNSDPLYNFYVDGFSDIGSNYESYPYGTFDKKPSEEYADAIVSDLLELEAPGGIEVESILVTGLWMRVHHHLYFILKTCGTDDPNTDLMGEHLDKAAALWIGRKQIHGSNTAGVMLYNLAERASVEFGQDKGESRVNSEFISILERIQLQILSDECSVTSDSNNVGYEKIYQLLSDALRQMNILLVQRLIHFMSTNVNEEYTKLYTLSLVPQIRACSTIDYSYFMDNVVLNTRFDRDTFDLSMKHLQKMYSCLGVTCGDIGSYSGSRVPQCEESVVEPNLLLAGYQPLSDIRRYAKVDRDILQIRILLSKNNTGAAKDVYRYGRNMAMEESAPTSLKSLATEFESGDEQRLYTYFEEYYDNNPAYADKLVLDAFEDIQDRTQIAIPRILQTIVVAHYAVRVFFEAVDLCEENNVESSLNFDKGVAVLVGSLEGEPKGGSNDGLSWFSLAKEFCIEFNCGDIYNPPANKKMMELFDSVRYSIINGICSNVEFLIDQMESILLIPIIQGLLYYSKMRQENPDSILFYESAKIFAQAVVPLVEKVSVSESLAIENYLLNDIDDPVDAGIVWTAIFNVMDDGPVKLSIGVRCEDIGNPNLFLNGESFCNYVGG